MIFFDFLKLTIYFFPVLIVEFRSSAANGAADESSGLVEPRLLDKSLATSISTELNWMGTTCSINSMLAIPPASSLMHSPDSEARITHNAFCRFSLGLQIKRKPTI